MQNRPPSHIRVLDFGHYLAGPLVGMMLADLGAEVIRINPPGGPRWRDPAFDMLSRGKRADARTLDRHWQQDKETNALSAAGSAGAFRPVRFCPNDRKIDHQPLHDNFTRVIYPTSSQTLERECRDARTL